MSRDISDHDEVYPVINTHLSMSVHVSISSRKNSVMKKGLI